MQATKKKAIFFGISAGISLAAVVYLVIQKRREKKLTAEVLDYAENTANKILANPEELTKPEKTEILNKIKVRYEGEHLTIQTVEDIAETILKFCISDFIKLSRQNRKERREVESDHAQRYVELQTQYENELREIIERSRAEVLERLNLNAITFDMANPLNDDENIEKNFTLNTTLRKKLLLSIPATKSLTFEELKEILRVQAEELKKESERVYELSEKTNDRVNLVHITQNKVYDTLFRKYTVEREDIEAFSHVYQGNVEVQRLLAELEKANEELFKVQDIRLSYAEYVITQVTFV